MANPTVGADSAHDNSARTEWYALLTQLRAVDARPSDGRSDEELEAEIDLAGDLVDKLLALPAPDNAALVWKLDYILGRGETDLDCTPSYSKEYIWQAIVDYHCFLGDAA